MNDKKYILERVRAFLAHIKWSKFLTFSFFVFLSAIFWFMQVYRQSFESTLHIPVKYVDLPDSIVFDNNLPSYIDVRIRDNGYTLFRYYLTKQSDSLEINISHLIKNSPNGAIQGPLLEQYVRTKLLPTSEILGYNPIRISFQYSTLEYKKLPVIFDGQILLAAGYLLSGDIITIPDSVMVYGAKEVIRKLTYAYTMSDTIINFKSKNPLMFNLKPIKGLKFSPSSIQVNVPVEEYTQKDLTVSVKCINLPENLNVKFFPSMVKLSFFVGLSKYPTITENDFTLELDYNDLKDMNDSSVPIRVISSPSYIQNLVISPSEVEFIFEQK